MLDSFRARKLQMTSPIPLLLLHVPALVFAFPTATVVNPFTNKRLAQGLRSGV